MNQEIKAGNEDDFSQNDAVKKIIEQLEEMEKNYVTSDSGVVLRPSQCYYVGTDPFHILFNTNCPDSLKQRIETLMNLHMPK